MNAQTTRFAVTFARAWVGLYTLGAASSARERRRAEIASDLWESVHGAEPVGSLDVLWRVGIGIPDDLGWAIGTHDASERMTKMSAAVHQNSLVRLVATFVLGSVVAALIALTIGGSWAAVTVTLGVMGIVGFDALGLSMTAPKDSLGIEGGASVNNHIATRRKQLLGIIVICVALVGVTWMYAISLDDWGNTRTFVFNAILFICTIVALAALALLISDAVKASRRP
jgi:hypothetical protein